MPVDVTAELAAAFNRCDIVGDFVTYNAYAKSISVTVTTRVVQQ